jgi:agmatinase
MIEYKYRKSMEPYINYTYPKVYGNVPTFLAVPLAKSKEDLKEADAAIIGGFQHPYTENVWRSDLGLIFEPRSSLGANASSVTNAMRLRKASIKYGGYIPELGIDVFEHIKLVDYGDMKTTEKIDEALDANCIPITICAGGENVIRSVAKREKGKVGVLWIDAHGDNACPPPYTSGGPDRLAYEKIVDMKKWIQIGMVGPRNFKEQVKWYKERGSHIYTYWKIREMGMEAVCKDVLKIMDEAEGVCWNMDTDVLGLGAAPGVDEPLGIEVSDLLILALNIGKSGKFSSFNVDWIVSPIAAQYQILTWTILYLLAGLAIGRGAKLDPA